MRIILAIVLSSFVVAAATPAEARVVPPTSTVGNLDHADWLEVYWRASLKQTDPAPTCLRTRGLLMTLAGPTGPRTTYRCNARAGSTVYLNAPSSACSNVEKPPFFGRTKAELMECAEEQYDGFIQKLSFFVDGKAVRRPDRFTVATGPFRVRLPKGNDLNPKKRSARLAAHGSGLLITGLDPGVHVLKARIDAGDLKATLIYRICIR